MTSSTKELTEVDDTCLDKTFCWKTNSRGQQMKERKKARKQYGMTSISDVFLSATHGRITSVFLPLCLWLCACGLSVAEVSSQSSLFDKCKCETKSGVKVWDCSGLGLTTLPQVLPACGDGSKLRANFSGNSLQNVEVRDYFAETVSLDLSSNRLATVSNFSTANFSTLQELHLNNNELRCLPRELKSVMPGVASLYLSSNPWLCDCSVVWLADWLRSLSTDSARCKEPEAMYERSLADVEEEDVCPHGGLSPGAIAGIVVGIFSYFSILSAIALCINTRRRFKTESETTEFY